MIFVVQVCVCDVCGPGVCVMFVDQVGLGCLWPRWVCDACGPGVCVMFVMFVVQVGG